MILTDVIIYLMKGTLTNIKGVLKGDGKSLSEIGVDATPTANSKNLLESGGAKSALDDKQNKITSSGVLIGDGTGGVSSKTLDTAKLTDDNNHVPTSGVVKSDLNTKATSFSATISNSLSKTFTFAASDCSIIFSSGGNASGCGLYASIAVDGSGVLAYSEGVSVSGLTLSRSGATLTITNGSGARAFIFGIVVSGAAPSIS